MEIMAFFVPFFDVAYEQFGWVIMCVTVLEPLDQLASPEPHASHLRGLFTF